MIFKSIRAKVIYCLTFIFAGILFFVSCSTSAISPIDQWATAMFTGDYKKAERLLDVSNFSSWRATTEVLNEQHDGFESYQRRTKPGEPENNGTTTLILTWKDSTTRCISLQTTNDGRVVPLSSTYEPC